MRRAKGPAPGLPLPERREVRLQLSAEELQLQLDMLETQQLGLERQGVLVERMIRDKCEGKLHTRTLLLLHACSLRLGERAATSSICLPSDEVVVQAPALSVTITIEFL